MAQSVPLQAHCPQCQRAVRISEPFAFGGRDRLRMTLACGHVVLRDDEPEFVCDYCGLPEADCLATRAGNSITVVTPAEYLVLKTTGERP
jgi:hypothetical protein